MLKTDMLNENGSLITYGFLLSIYTIINKLTRSLIRPRINIYNENGVANILFLIIHLRVDRRRSFTNLMSVIHHWLCLLLSTKYWAPSTIWWYVKDCTWKLFSFINWYLLEYAAALNISTKRLANMFLLNKFR